MTTTTTKDTEQYEQTWEMLRAKLPVGSHVAVSIEHVSKSGMSRDVRLTIAEDNRVKDITWAAARLLDERLRNDGTIRIGGCGFDARFEAVYRLSYALYPAGFECIGETLYEEGFRNAHESCPSNDHVNGDRDYTPHHHTSGGYALLCDRL